MHTYTVGFAHASVTIAHTHDPMLLSLNVIVPPFPWMKFHQNRGAITVAVHLLVAKDCHQRDRKGKY